MNEDGFISKTMYMDYFKGINDISIQEYNYFLEIIKKELY
jgi:hypothetical protein